MTKIATIDPELSGRYRSAVVDYRAALAERSSDSLTGYIPDLARVRAAEQAVRDVVRDIRTVPGCADFLKATTTTDVASTAGRNPLIYLISAPHGSYVLSVRQGPSGAPIVEGTLVTAVTSVTVLQVVLFDQESGSPGLLAAQSGSTLSRRRNLPIALARLENLQLLIEPVARLLEQAPERRCILVPTGLLGLVPLHAVPASQSRPLILDDIGDTYLAPSAKLYAASLNRATQPEKTHLVAIADPGGDLAGARAEVATISSLFAACGQVSTREGQDATQAWLLERLPHATHLHLACHGSSTFADQTGGTLYLGAGSQLTVDAMLNGRLPKCRLAVASACQSGHYSLAQTPDEFTGLPAAFLQAGAACAIVSLWQVDDWATALLMTRFYELLAPTQPDRNIAPAAALRHARTWLRTLTNQQCTDYLTRHPQLGTGISSNPKPSTDLTTDRPYAAPQYWAAFTPWGR